MFQNSKILMIRVPGVQWIWISPGYMNISCKAKQKHGFKISFFNTAQDLSQSVITV